MDWDSAANDDRVHIVKAANDNAQAVACPSNTADAGRARQCDGCPGQQFCKSSSGVDPEQNALDVRMGAIKHKILVVSGKGGVGKSSMACQLAVALSKRGKKICGPSVPTIMAVEEPTVHDSPYGWIPVTSPQHDIKIMSIGFLMEDPDSAVVWRGPRKTSMIKRFLKDTYWGRLDFLVVDTPPGTSDEHLSVVMALKNSKPDGALIVTTPQDVSLITVKKEVNFCQKVGIPVLGIVENMSSFVCPCCDEVSDIFSSGGGAKLAAELGLPFLGSIPLDPRMGQSADSGVSLFEAHPDAPSLKSFATVVDNLFVQLQPREGEKL